MAAVPRVFLDCSPALVCHVLNPHSHSFLRLCLPSRGVDLDPLKLLEAVFTL